MPRKGYIIVEGHGEVKAVANLIWRLGANLCPHIPWTTPRRWLNLHRWEGAARGGVRAGAEFVRSKPDAGALLILRDEDDACPKDVAPAIAERLRALSLPFPVAYVLLHPEYEVLFLPCLEAMGFPKWDRDSWEARRGIKEWLSKQLPQGRSYKPTVNQAAMTAQIDLQTLRDAGVPSFGSLERALRFLGANLETTGRAYP